MTSTQSSPRRFRVQSLISNSCMSGALMLWVAVDLPSSGPRQRARLVCSGGAPLYFIVRFRVSIISNEDRRRTIASPSITIASILPFVGHEIVFVKEVFASQRFDIDVVVSFGTTRPRRRHPALRHRLAGGIVGVVHDRVSPRSRLITRNAVETGCCKAAPAQKGGITSQAFAGRRMQTGVASSPLFRGGASSEIKRRRLVVVADP